MDSTAAQACLPGAGPSPQWTSGEELGQQPLSLLTTCLGLGLQKLLEELRGALAGHRGLPSTRLGPSAEA